MDVSAAPAFGHASGVQELQPGLRPQDRWSYSGGMGVSYQLDLFGQIRRAIEAGTTRLIGLYRATAKNKPFGDFYRAWGMSPNASAPDGAQRWARELGMDASALTLPPWIEIDEI